MDTKTPITTTLRSGEVFREDARGNVTQRPGVAPIGEYESQLQEDKSTASAERMAGVMHAVTGSDFRRSMAWGERTPNAVAGAIRAALPAAKDSATSQAAADSMTSHAQKQAAEVLACIRAAGTVGRCCCEVEEELNMKHESASARITGLLREGAIVRTERTRPTRSGRAASVLICK